MKFFKRREKVEYTGVSAENAKNQAFIILIAEMLVIILLSGGVFIALNYFRIFPLSEMNPALFGWLPQNYSKIDESKINESNVINLPPHLKTESKENNTAKDMVAVSEIPDYELSIENKKQLIDFINQWNIYGSSYNVPFIGTTEDMPIESISVRLVGNDLGKNGYKFKEGDYYLSSDLKINPGRIDVLVYLSDDILNSSRSAEEKGDLVTTGVVSALYRLEEYIMGIRPPENMDPIFKELYKLGGHYFSVNKSVE